MAAIEYALLLGSNHQRAKAFRVALVGLVKHGDVVVCSGVTRTRSTSGSRYMNAALLLRCDLGFDAFKAITRNIEAQAGRERGRTDDRCVLDIDIVWSVVSDERVIHKPEELTKPYAVNVLGALASSD